MGNKISIPNSHVFEDDLKSLNLIINNMIDSKNVFKNNEYNFLSKDVCDKHTVLLEDELNKHLKVSLQSLGTSLYLIPNNDTNNKSNIKGSNITKREICQKISNHYMKILYVISLIKYVYDIERHGDFSIAGIIFRNIKVIDDIMVIDYCSIPHKDYSNPNPSQKDKIDFNKLEGLSFFTKYVLDNTESKLFVDVIKGLLSRKPKGIIKNYICEMKKGNMLSSKDLTHIENLYVMKYRSPLVCSLGSGDTKTSFPDGNIENKVNLQIKVEKDNPVFLKEYCFNVKKTLVKTDTPNGKIIVNAFKTMKQNYNNNVKMIETLLNKLVVKKHQGYELRDITKTELDTIVYEVKSTVKTFFIQSIIDFQHLLDMTKTHQIIQLNKDT
jgi:hypothetical protein